jgi:transposase
MAGHQATNSTESDFYGILKSEHAIYTTGILNIDSHWLNNWLRKKVTAETNIIEQHHLNIFEAVADLSKAKLFRINNSSHFKNGKFQIDEIDLFWGILKSRLTKFRGLNITQATFISKNLNSVTTIEIRICSRSFIH